MRQHTQEEPFDCEVCDRKFKDSGNRDDHLRRHFDLKPFMCKLCPEQYYRKYMLKKHLQKKHQVKEKIEEFIFKADLIKLRAKS